LIAAQEGVLTLTGTSLSVDLAPLFAQL